MMPQTESRTVEYKEGQGNYRIAILPQVLAALLCHRFLLYDVMEVKVCDIPNYGIKSEPPENYSLYFKK